MALHYRTAHVGFFSYWVFPHTIKYQSFDAWPIIISSWLSLFRVGEYKVKTLWIRSPVSVTQVHFAFRVICCLLCVFSEFNMPAMPVTCQWHWYLVEVGTETGVLGVVCCSAFSHSEWVRLVSAGVDSRLIDCNDQQWRTSVDEKDRWL